MIGSARLFALVGICLLAGCAPNLVPFRHDIHVERYEITSVDLQKLHFYVSSQIIGHGEEGEGVLILATGTPGVAVAAGEESIVVSFEKGGQGAPFVLERSRQIYRIGTEVPGRSGLQPLQSTKDKILRVGSRRFKVVQGSDAFLIVEEKEIQKLIQSRPHLTGRTTE